MEKNENEITEDSPFYVKHLFGTMVFFSIIIALTLVMVSMSLYYSSGSSQLDLSSPGYIDVRDQIEDEKKYGEFSNVGTLDKTSFEQYKSLFEERFSRTKLVDVYGGDPLSPESVGIVEITVDSVVR